jgi:alanyl-tRNA synthetase
MHSRLNGSGWYGCAVVLDTTGFHAEGGGQLGDVGTIKAPAGVLEVTNTKKFLMV